MDRLSAPEAAKPIGKCPTTPLPPDQSFGRMDARPNFGWNRLRTTVGAESADQCPPQPGNAQLFLSTFAPATGPRELIKAPSQLRRLPTPSPLQNNRPVVPGSALALRRRAPVCAGGRLLARDAPKAPGLVRPQTMRRCGRPNVAAFLKGPSDHVMHSQFRRSAGKYSTPAAENKRAVTGAFPIMAASSPSGITVIPGKAREARIAASMLQAVAICVSRPRRSAPSARRWMMFSSDPNKEASPPRSRTMLSGAVSSTRGDIDQARSSKAACAIRSWRRERWRIPIPPNCSTSDLHIPGLIPLVEACWFKHITGRSGEAASTRTIALIPIPGAERTTACSIKSGTKMEAKDMATPTNDKLGAHLFPPQLSEFLNGPLWPSTANRGTGAPPDPPRPPCDSV